ncbi:MAG: hypothetical protein OEW87_12635 [Flavobacteriaceae bacterium]|nr:hypothetical protein [Flavobacteriaceae bacterium]
MSSYKSNILICISLLFSFSGYGQTYSGHEEYYDHYVNNAGDDVDTIIEKLDGSNGDLDSSDSDAEYRWSRSSLDTDYSSVIEYHNDRGVSIYNTGVALQYKHDSGFQSNLKGSLDGKLDEIDSDSFNLDNFIKEFNVAYKYDQQNVGLILTVGKIASGVKMDQNDPSAMGGKMGIRLSIGPKKIPLIQNWLERHNLKITSINISRFDSDSKERFEWDDLESTNETNIAIRASRGRNLHVFYIQNIPDTDYEYGVSSMTVGGIYMFDHELKPSLFMMKHNSQIDNILDLDLHVVSASALIMPKYGVRGGLTYANATESLRNTQTDTYGIKFSKTLVDRKKFKLKLNLGYKHKNYVTNHNEDEDIYYFRLEGNY